MVAPVSQDALGARVAVLRGADAAQGVAVEDAVPGECGGDLGGCGGAQDAVGARGLGDVAADCAGDRVEDVQAALVDVGRVGEVVRTDVQLPGVGVQQHVERFAGGGELGRLPVADGPGGYVDALAAASGLLTGEGDGDAHVLGAVAAAPVVDAGDDRAGHGGAVEAVARCLDVEGHVEGAAVAVRHGEVALVGVALGHDPAGGRAVAGGVGAAQAGAGDTVVAVVLAEGDVDALGLVVSRAGDLEGLAVGRETCGGGDGEPLALFAEGGFRRVGGLGTGAGAEGGEREGGGGGERGRRPESAA